MAFSIQTAAELAAQFIANFEARINQTVPSFSRSFLRVLSKVQAIQVTGLYKYATERALQTLALTATGDDLDIIGEEYGVFRKSAEAAILELTATGTNGTVIPIGTEWVSDDTNAVYTVDASATIASGTAIIQVTAEIPGELGTLPLTATLTIGSPISGVDSTAAVDRVVNEGLDRETDTEYRRRILNEIRTVGGGGNSADYRTWAEEVADVNRAFPYAGKPVTFSVTGDDISFAAVDDSINSTTTDFTDAGLQVDDFIDITGAATGANNRLATIVAVSSSNKIIVDFTPTNESAGATVTIENESLPGDRTVYIESRIGDGIPTQTLLDEARDSINTDPSTGIARPPLGETDDTLWVEPITKTEFDVEVDNVQLSVELRAATETKLESALTTYFASAVPFIVGLDFDGDKNDVITDLSVSRVVQDVIASVGGAADAVTITVGVTPYTIYELGQGELAEFGALTVNYA